MLKALSLAIIASFASCAHASTDDNAVIEVWKVGDDGLTNRLYDQINQETKLLRIPYQQSSGARKYVVLIEENVRPEGKDNLSYKISLYNSGPFDSNPIMKFAGICSLREQDCLSKIIPVIRYEVTKDIRRVLP